MIIARELKGNFKKIVKYYNIIALVGPRQSGKTTFLREIMHTKEGHYLTFDDPDIRTLFGEDIKKFELQYIEGKEATVLDEINYATNAGINLKYLSDKNHKLWLSSSSELILSREVISYLVGRVSILRMYPFSLREFFGSKTQKTFNETILNRNIWEHINFGGYPKVVITEDKEIKKTILHDLYETMVLKDIAQTFSISDVKSLEKFIHYLSLNNGKMFSFEKVCNEIKLSFQTVKRYFDAMKKSYLLLEVPPFYSNKLKEIIKKPKVYFLDTGMRNVIARQFSAEISGELFENYVLLELIKAGFSPKYWRTKSGREVDFILDLDEKIIPIEVKLNSNGNITSSLASFTKEYSSEKAFIVSYKGSFEKNSKKINSCDVVFCNIYDLISLLNKMKKE